MPMNSLHDLYVDELKVGSAEIIPRFRDIYYVSFELMFTKV